MYKLKGKSVFEKYSNLESLSQVFFMHRVIRNIQDYID